jgi:hypothetical protein
LIFIRKMKSSWQSMRQTMQMSFQKSIDDFNFNSNVYSDGASIAYRPSALISFSLLSLASLKG